jgi:1-deoxy-D-xylulose-5-phosphate synthase
MVAIGAAVEIAWNASLQLADEGISCTVVNARFCKPLDATLLLRIAKACGKVITVEDSQLPGGFGSAVVELLTDNGVMVPVRRIGLPDEFIEHGTVPVLRSLVGLTADRVAEAARDLMGHPPPRPVASGKRTGDKELVKTAPSG